MTDPINEANWAPPPPVVERLESVPALVIQPGDRVLVFVAPGTSKASGDRIKAELANRFPDVQWTVMAGAVALMRIPGGTDD